MGQDSTWATTTHEWARELDLEHLAAMQRELSRPGASGGRRHLILEILAYAQDKATANSRRGTVAVTRNADGSVTVDDDGRGTDTRVDGEGRIVRKPVMSTADVRFADPARAPVLPDGLPRRGMSSVAAVSALLVHENHRENGSWAQTYRHGIPDVDLKSVESRGYSGTVVTFRTDVDGPDQLTRDDLSAFPDLIVQVV